MLFNNSDLIATCPLVRYMK